VSFGPVRTSGSAPPTLVDRLRCETDLDDVMADEVGEWKRTPKAHHGPPIANQSSRVSASVLGMLLFIASEVMLFGSFFSAYFFVRVVNGIPWPPAPFELPIFVARRQYRDPRHLELHDALGAPVDQARQPRRSPGRSAADLPDGLVFLLTQAREYSRVGFAPHDGAFGTIFYCLTGLHGAHVFVGLSILLFMTIRAFRGHFSPEHHYGVEIEAIYWHFVDVMWIVVYSTVYLI